MKIEIIKSDFGYIYTFNLKEPDGSATDLTGAPNVKLKATHSEKEGVVVSADMEIVGDGPTGKAEYTLAAEDFVKSGVYYGEVEVTRPDLSQISYQGFTIVVLPKV